MASNIPSDVVYTYFSQGLSGTPPLIAKPTVIQSFEEETWHSILTFETSNDLGNILYTWGGMTDFYNFCRGTGADITLFTPSNKVDGFSRIRLTNDGTTAYCVIQCVDENNNVIRAQSVDMQGLIALGEGSYRNTSVLEVEGIVVKEAPIYLYMWGDIASNQLDFHLASDVIVSNYTNIGSVNYNGNVGSSSMAGEFYEWALDGVRADSKGGAPTGSPEGGGGMWDYPFGAIGEPQLPTVSVCDTGMISLWNTNSSQMYQLANKLWDNNFFNSIIKNFQSPMDNIISLHVVPFTVYGGTQANIHIGNYDTEIPSNRLSTSYFNIDCGIIELTGAYQSFADYAPFTDIQLYLPFINTVPISADDIQDGAINVKYNIDVFTGACVAYIMIKKRGLWTCINQYTGNIATSYPITGANYTNVYMGLAQSAFKALTAGALFGALGAGSVGIGALGGITPELAGVGAGAMLGSSMQGALTARPTYQRSGGISANAGLMGVLTPYLIISKPNFIQANNFREQKGYISNLECHIGDESGYISASVTNEQLTDIDCSSVEREMIKKCLAEGVYI